MRPARERVAEREGWVPRLLALDIDGTLADYDGQIAPSVIRAVQAARRAGAHVVLATGRSVLAGLPIARRLGLEAGFMVCSNGAVTVDLADPDTMDAVTFDASPAVRALLAVAPDTLVAVEELGRGYRVSAPFPDGELVGEQIVCSLEEMVGRPVTKVVLRRPESTPEELFDLVERAGLHGVNYVMGYSAWLDILPREVSKASALERVRHRLGVGAEDTLAVGDGRNDVEMLAWAAHGVAMGNAPVEVQDLADEVIWPVQEEGAARLLARWFDGGSTGRGATTATTDGASALAATPQLVATDLDGTLVRSDGSVSARSVRVLRALAAAGVHLVLVTGRPPRWLAPAVQAVGHTGLVVCANGALVLDLKTGATLAEHLIGVDVLATTIDRLDTRLPGLSYAVEFSDGAARGPDYRVSETARAIAEQARGAIAAQARGAMAEELARVLTVDRAGLTSRPALKLLARHAEAHPDHLLERVRELVGDIVEVTHSSREGLVEISAYGVSKASALAGLCETLGLTAEQVVAFGDMPNDLPMLAWAGQAWAMANAHHDVLTAVRRHAPGNDEDGVAVVLEQLYGLG